MAVEGASAGLSVADERILATGEEAGTAPGDRRFRPDVEGLRAVAVLLVVLYHAGVPRLTGGYVGVDVFFVISGFVITGLLLRERQGTSRTSIIDFYARRCRRILPAATLVIVVTVLCSYLWLGFVSGNIVANDGRWAAVFLSNFHFEQVGTNYFTATQAPSPLQNYWTLSVEEQFYVVYPTLFLLVARGRRRLSVQVRMASALGVVIIGSYILSIVQTNSHPAAAYFSPFTRAWELALGALVAVSTPWLKQIPARIAASVTWVGLAAILFAAFAFSAQTSYPGSLVAVPVLGTALVIAGGVAVPRSGAEWLLGGRAFGWLGQRSYSLYLWHWPVLIIAAEHVGKSTLPVGENLVLVLFALMLSMATYRLVENPARHFRIPSGKSVMMGLTLVATTVIVLSLMISVESPWESPYSSYRVLPAANTQVVLDEVAAANRITQIPNPVHPSLAQAPSDFGGIDQPSRCGIGLLQSRGAICTLGDPKGKPLMIVYGDSHALMWLPAFNGLAKAAHWRLIVLGKSDCPAAIMVVPNPPGIGEKGAPYGACNLWHQWAVKKINQLHPSLLVISTQDHGWYPPYWKAGITKLFSELSGSVSKVVYLGDIPLLPQPGPECLAAHVNDVQACSASLKSSMSPLIAIDRSVVAAHGAEYVDTTPWFCSRSCTAVVGNYDVYLDQFHITATYAEFLQNALAQSLGVLPVGGSG